MRAALSLDLDNKWSYMKTHGDVAWESYPSYINMLVPKVLDLLDRLGLRITIFIVGQDAALPTHRDALGQIVSRGHEIGNHSYFHEPWMHRRSNAAIEEEFAMAEDAIERATGERPRGFRGPGFTRSQSILETLARRGYLYDASSLPTFIGPLARAYYFRSVKMSPKAMQDREDLFGRFGDGFRPNRPHRIRLEHRTITEVPVTTFPIVRLPIHISYVLYIATVSPALALAYFRAALFFCKLTRTEPSILLHPLDFLSGEDCPELAFFPAMNLDPQIKAEVLERALTMLKERFDVLPLREFVAPGSSYSPLATSAS